MELGNTLVLFLLLILLPLTYAYNTLLLPPRLQWNENFGYCGETSLISAGLFYGQYCSQYTARDLASPDIDQNEEGSQLLLGVNFEPTVEAMRLKSNTFNTKNQRTSQEFLNWISREVLSNHPVIIGVFTNEYKFYGDEDTQAGDAEYDHIVPVVSLTNPSNSGVLTFSDNGLWTGSTKNNSPTFLFNLTNRDAFKTRAQANAPSAPIYSLIKRPDNYGISITGIIDTNKDTVPVILSTDVNYETPEIRDGSSNRPASMPLELTATVKIPNQGVAYNLYMYNSFESVPTSRFNAQASNAVKSWKIPTNSGTTYTVRVNIKSDQIAAFRAVRETAP